MRKSAKIKLMRRVCCPRIRHFPLVFNGPYIVLRANDLPSIPSIATSMRSIIQNMESKPRRKEAKRLYEVRHSLK